MLLINRRVDRPFETETLRSMFEARREVFVDLLGWDVPVIDGRYEVDQFDDIDAVYLVVADRSGRHLGSARLLKTVRPHILDTLFPQLCEAPLPRGVDVLEITRFCLDRAVKAAARRSIRNTLVAGLADYALSNGIRSYTGVAEVAWLQQILAFGWRCRPLGLPRKVGADMLGALRIDISEDTPRLLREVGIVAAEPTSGPRLAEAA